jgi:predicted metal-dependent phosphoesterase TrpH
MIDLHTHTTASDGTVPPADLIREALDLSLEALAITDHDILAGYDEAAPLAGELDLIAGIELSTKYGGKSVHLLGYFLGGPPPAAFRTWLLRQQASRRDRNTRLVKRLNSLGIDLTLPEVEARGGVLTGRPHFARVLVEKGYVKTPQEAFDEYLDESAKGYVDRQEVTLEEGIEIIAASGGMPVIAHPVRIHREPQRVAAAVAEMKGMGLQGVEVYHSDHSEADVRFFEELASRLDLQVTGGSDYHGTVKARIRLGTGYDGNLNIPRSVLDRLREAVSA